MMKRLALCLFALGAMGVAPTVRTSVIVNSTSDVTPAVIPEVFAADYDEQDMGVPDGACTQALAEAQWTMDEASGSIVDECSTVSLGANGDPTYAITGLNGTGDGIRLDGSGDYFRAAGDEDTMDLGTEDFVVDLTACWDGGQGTVAINDKGGGAGVGWETYMLSGDPVMRLRNTSTNDFVCGTCQPTHDFSCHNLRIEVDRDTDLQYYIDGIFQESDATNADSQGDLSNAALFTIGANSAGAIAIAGDILDWRFCKGATAFADCPSLYDDGLDETQGSTPTFVRTTASTRYDRTLSEGEEVHPGVAAIGADVDSDGTLPEGADPVGLWIGSQTDFLLLRNEDFTNGANWVETGTAVATADNATDHFGGGRADKLEDDDGAAVEKICQSITVSAGVAHTGTVWYQDDTGTPTPVLELDGTQQTCAVSSSDWKRCEVNDASSSGTSIDFCVYPAGTTAASTGAINAFRGEVYAKGFAVPHDPAVVTSTSINAADLSYATVNVPWTKAVLAMWVNTPDVGSGTSRQIFEWLGGGDSFQMALQSDWLRVVSTGLAGGNFDTISTDTISADTPTHLCAELDELASSIKLYFDGVEASYGGHDQTWDSTGAASITTMDIGGRSGTLSVNAFVSGAAVYNTLATDCATLYAAGNPAASLHPHGVPAKVMYAARERLKAAGPPAYSMNPKPWLEATR